MTDKTSTFRAVSQFLHHHLLWFLLAAYVLASVSPAAGLWMRNRSFGHLTVGHDTLHISLLMVMLAVLMFNAGLGLKLSHLQTVLQQKRVLIAGLVANLAMNERSEGMTRCRPLASTPPGTTRATRTKATIT